MNQQTRLLDLLHTADWSCEHFGLVICDLTRHVAKCFGVDEDVVWAFVCKERRQPTSDIIGGKMQ